MYNYTGTTHTNTTWLTQTDLLAYRNNIVYSIDTQISTDTIDTQISTDTIDTDTNYRHKTYYYNKPEILSYAKQLTGAKQAKLSASCWNWRGIPSSLTSKDLYSLGLRKHDITLLSIRVMTDSLQIYRKYCCNGLLQNP